MEGTYRNPKGITGTLHTIIVHLLRVQVWPIRVLEGLSHRLLIVYFSSSSGDLAFDICQEYQVVTAHHQASAITSTKWSSLERLGRFRDVRGERKQRWYTVLPVNHLYECMFGRPGNITDPEKHVLELDPI